MEMGGREGRKGGKCEIGERKGMGGGGGMDGKEGQKWK